LSNASISIWRWAEAGNHNRDEISLMLSKKTFVVGMLCIAAPQLTIAEDSNDLHPYLESGFSLDIGIFYPDRKLDLRVNGSVGINDEIDFDEGTRLDGADDIFAAELAWRYRGRWSIIGQYFKTTDTTRAVLEEDIEWGNIVFGAGSNAAVGTQFSLTRIFFGRQFNTSNFHDVGIGAGIHWLHMGAFIEGEILVNGIPAAARRSVSAEAPLPNIGTWYKYSISPRWALRARLDLFSANIDDYDGRLINFGLGVNYQVFEHVGIGMNYNYVELDVKINKSDWRGNIETTYDGIFVYASVYY
jgi:hypothetical protein